MSIAIRTISAEYETEFYQEYLQYFSSQQISSPFRKLLDILSSTESKILLDDVPSAIDVSQVCFKTLWFDVNIYILIRQGTETLSVSNQNSVQTLQKYQYHHSIYACV